MSKLTKREIQLHDQAVCLLQKEHLSHEDKLFIFENFREDAEHINSKSGAFFTPFGLANDFTLQIPCLYGKTIRIIDLCAGIGVLSYAAQLECSDRSRCYADITCVELNPHYVEVGKKVVPEATWICADVLDPFLPDLLGQFDFAIANPPFGRIANNYRKSYMSGEFELRNGVKRVSLQRKKPQKAMSAIWMENTAKTTFTSPLKNGLCRWLLNLYAPWRQPMKMSAHGRIFLIKLKLCRSIWL